MEMEMGVHRWLVDLTQWNPSPEHFSFTLSTLPPHEHSAITRFVQLQDRKRALVSRLLQYALVHQVTKTPFDEISIKRTLEGKPYIDHQTSSEFANFNFNTSHDGDYVGIVSEPMHIVGLDIVSRLAPKQETELEFVRSFSSHFTENEWEDIIRADDILAQFCRYWCLKEAYVKATGAGVGYVLNRLEFRHRNWSNIMVCIDGEESTEWEFSLSELGDSHWVSIARGHPKNAVESYKKTLHVTELEEVEIVPFTTNFALRTVEELLPSRASNNGVRD